VRDEGPARFPLKDSSNQDLARTVGRSTIFGIVSNVVRILTRLVTVPIVIHHLGLGGYGIWNVVMMTATYMRFGSVGVKTAFQKYVAEATGSGDYEKANKLLSTGTAIMLGLSVAGLIPVAIFSERIARVSGVPPNFLNSAAESVSLLALIMLMSNACGAFEGIVMGGHRIDLLNKVSTVLVIAEAIGIVAVLQLGFGLAAMACVMGASELCYLTFCFFASHRVVPQVRLRIRSMSKEALVEFFRFAGSYQLVNLMEVAYGALVPVAILRSFGADSAGVYALVNRLVGSAAMLQYSFLSPIVSAGAMVFASGASEQMKALLKKTFKITLGLSLFPLGFFALFGPTVALAWTGQTDSRLGMVFWVSSASALFAAFSLLSLVLYRATGNVLLDNLRQVFRISSIVVVVSLAPQLGFLGVLVGIAICELAAMLFMLYALHKTFEGFRARFVLPGMMRLSMAAVLIFAAGTAATHIRLPGIPPGQMSATVKLAQASLACLLVAWPLLSRTGSLTVAEKDALSSLFLPRLHHSKG
jgi:O-antigen/teichoic acid export membrane protein